MNPEAPWVLTDSELDDRRSELYALWQSATPAERLAVWQAIVKTYPDGPTENMSILAEYAFFVLVRSFPTYPIGE